MTPEGKVKKEIKAYLTACGAEFFMPQNFGMGKSGVSDFIGMLAGVGFAIEAKRAETEGPDVEYATPWQFRFMRDWRNALGFAGVARSIEDVQDILSERHRPIDPLQPDRTE